MARLELPILQFLTTRAKAAFPRNSWGKSSAISDLVLKSMAVLFQPLRSEIDSLKINQSILNYQYMRPQDLDALAANWGTFRQTGSRSFGTVRIIFSDATPYQLDFLQFLAVDGTSFVLIAPVTITAQQLMANRQQDNTYFFDVAVQSTGIGNRYALPAGSITSVVNAPSGILSVTNLDDFAVTAPNQTNYDIANQLFKNLGLRNLVSPSSIRAPLLDNFAGIIDIVIAGADSQKMTRDLVNVTIAGQSTQIHVGGMTDIWINTSSVVQNQVTFSYLPSSGRARLVSAIQSEQNEVLYTFARSLVDIDGLYSSPDFPTTLLDESTGILFSIADLLAQTTVLPFYARGRYPLSSLDILSGTDMLVMPSPNNDILNSPLLTDITGFDFSNTALQPGDQLAYNSNIQKVTRQTARVIETGPPVRDAGSIIWSDLNSTLIVSPGDRFIPYVNDGHVANVNDRCVIPGGDAAGIYRILAVDTTGFWVGNVVSKGSLSYVSHDSSLNQTTYTYNGDLPPDVGSNCWVDLATDFGFNQTSADWLRIVSVTGLTIVTQGGASADTSPVQIVQGLRDSLLDQTLIRFESDQPANFARSVRQIFGAEGPPSVSNVGHTLYVNDTDTLIDVGVVRFAALGLGRTATVGNLLLFEGTATIDAQDLYLTQGDGTKFTVLVDSIIDDDTITFRPALPFQIPVGTRYALMRSAGFLASLSPSAVNTVLQTLKFDTWPVGLGDGVGYFVKHNSDFFTVLYSTVGALRTLSFDPPKMAIDVTFSATGYITANPSDVGSTVMQVLGGGNTAIGILTAFNNTTRVWSLIPNDSSVDIFYTSGSIPISIQNSLAIGFVTAISSPYAVGYFDPNSGDAGSIVRQGTYTGVLQSFDSTSHTWVIKPLSAYDLFDNTSPSVVTFVDYGSGQPTPGLGQGTVFQPASAAALNLGPVFLTLDRPVGTISAEDTVLFYPRFPNTGGFLNGNTFETLGTSSIQNNPFASTLVNDELIVLLGGNEDTYNVLGKTTYDLTIDSSPIPDFVRINNAPPAQPLVLASTITANTMTLSVSGSGLGFWAHFGRVLILTVGNTPYYLGIAEANGQDGIDLIDPVPISIFSNQSVAWEIVEAYHLPFWTTLPTALQNYRFYRQPALGDVIYIGSNGSHDASEPTHFVDASVDFDEILQGLDLAPGDVILYIDDGPEATTVPFVLTSETSNTLVFSGAIATTATGLAYHLVRRNNAWNNEFWVNGTVDVSGSFVTITPPAGWDIIRNGTYAEWVWDVTSSPKGDPSLGDWQAPGLVGVFDPMTGNIALDFTATHFTPNTAVPTSSGFDVPYRNQPCRVMPRLADRSTAHALSGSAIESFNYYLRDFFTLPLVRIVDVQLLNAQTLQSVRSLGYSLAVNDIGLRYSDSENNSLVIAQADMADAVGQPIKVIYLSDASIAQVNAYLQEPDTRIVNGNQLAKRMETVAIDITVSVRSQLNETDLGQKIATFVNTLDSTIPLSKDKLIQYLYQNNYVSYIDVGSIVLASDYYQANGTVSHAEDVDQTFGAETACYLARTVTVNQLATQV